MQNAIVILNALMLVFCLAQLVRYAMSKHRAALPVGNFAGLALLFAGMLLTQVAPETRAMTGIILAIFAVSLTLAVRSIILSKRKIAQFDAAEKTKRTHGPEFGPVYEGIVKSTANFGAMVELLPGTEGLPGTQGLLHISELQAGRTRNTEDVVKTGDVVRVKLLSIDENGKMRLSRKAALADDASANLRAQE